VRRRPRLTKFVTYNSDSSSELLALASSSLFNSMDGIEINSSIEIGSNSKVLSNTSKRVEGATAQTGQLLSPKPK
jgi:hypothetical protein